MENKGQVEDSTFSMEGLHPLENHVILKSIFQFCNLEELAACRQVSKVWRKSCMMAWRSKNYVIITKRNVPDYVKFMKNSKLEGTSSLYNHYRLGGTSAIKPFWRICGSNISILSLVDCVFPTVHDFRNAVFRNCPNVQRLTLVKVSCGKRKSQLTPTSDVEEPVVWSKSKFGENRNLNCLRIQRRSGYLCVSWTELFTHYPSVETLHLYGSDINDDNLFESINKIRQRSPTSLKFKEILTLNMNSTSSAPIVSPQLMTLVNDRGLSLERLSFGVNGHDGPLSLWDALHTNYRSLRTLEIYRDSRFPLLSPNQCFPALIKEQLASLKEMKLHSRVFTSLSFLKATPNLEKLAIRNQWSYSGGSAANNIISNTLIVYDMNAIKLQRCTELQVGIQTGEKEIEQLARWLPSVTKLTFSRLNNKTFAMVCQQWPKLVDLTITDSEVNELGITGLDESQVESLNLEQESCWSRDLTSISRSTASLVDLKDLERFSMSAFTPTTPIHFSAAVYGFEALPKLKHLVICEYKENSQDLWYMWRKRMQTERGLNFEMYHDPDVWAV